MGVGLGSFNSRGNFVNSLLRQSDLQRGHRGHGFIWSMSFLALLLMSISMFMESIGLRRGSLSGVVELMTTFSLGSDWI